MTRPLLLLALAPFALAAAEPEPVFREDFEQGAERWELSDEASWALREIGGDHALEITRRESDHEPEVRSPYHVALIKDMELASFEIRFRVRSTKDTGDHRDCCVFFNYQDPTHFYYVHLGARPDPHSGQIMIVDGAPRKAITENTKRVPWQADTWHQVKLVRDAEKGSIEVFFDDMDEPVMSVTDKTFGKGRIGIGSFDDMNAFDDLEVHER